MTLTQANLKWYKCITATPGNAQGGDIDIATPIVDDTSQNVFTNVADADRIAGITDYRKVYLRNQNTDDFPNALAWIEENFTATNQTIAIREGGTKGCQGQDSAALTGTCTFAASTAVVGSGTAFLSECAVGELIFNSTDDTNADGVAIASIETDTGLTLAGAYGGTAGASKGAKVAAISGLTFVQPDSKVHADVVACGMPDDGDLALNEYRAIWIKRIVTPGGLGITDDEWTILVDYS